MLNRVGVNKSQVWNMGFVSCGYTYIVSFYYLVLISNKHFLLPGSIGCGKDLISTRMSNKSLVLED